MCLITFSNPFYCPGFWYQALKVTKKGTIELKLKKICCVVYCHNFIVLHAITNFPLK